VVVAPTEAATRARTGTQAIGRVAGILRVVAGQPRGLRLVDIVRQTGLETPTAHRMVKAMIAEALLRQHHDTRRYGLGPLVYELGLATVPQHNLQGTCEQSVARLAHSSGDVAMLGVRSGLDSVCIDRQEGTHPVRAMTVQVGTRRPLGVGAGSLAILSGLEDELVDQIIAANSARLAQFNGLTESTLRDLVGATKEAGYALTHGEIFPDVGGVGVAIRDVDGAVIAGFGISTTINRLPAERVQQLVRLLRAEVAVVEAALARTETTGGR
jgi:DNA-binding IclR family transcriptional regulator